MSKSERITWVQVMEAATGLYDLLQRLRDRDYPDEKMADPFKKVGVNTSDGPMAYLGDIIVKRMEKAGYPSIVHRCWRTPEKQNEAFSKGHSNARAWESPHQYLEGVDIVHKSKFWKASPDYWETLANVVRTVAHEYGVALDHGHNWKSVDSAHVELSDWRNVRDRQKQRGYYARPTTEELAKRFEQVLPKVWAKVKPMTGSQIPVFNRDTGKIDYPI